MIKEISCSYEISHKNLPLSSECDLSLAIPLSMPHREDSFSANIRKEQNNKIRHYIGINEKNKGIKIHKPVGRQLDV